MTVLPTDREEIICPCSGTRKQRVAELLAEGERSLDRISRRTGAMSGCGSCENDLQQLLQQFCQQD